MFAWLFTILLIPYHWQFLLFLSSCMPSEPWPFSQLSPTLFSIACQLDKIPSRFCLIHMPNIYLMRWTEVWTVKGWPLSCQSRHALLLAAVEPNCWFWGCMSCKLTILSGSFCFLRIHLLPIMWSIFFTGTCTCMPLFWMYEFSKMHLS